MNDDQSDKDCALRIKNLAQRLIHMADTQRTYHTSDHYFDSQDLCRVALTVRTLQPDSPEDGRPTMLIEGSRESLEFLAEAILLHCLERRDCGFQMGPAMQGSAYFSESSEAGIYIHALPCMSPPKPDSKQ